MMFGAQIEHQRAISLIALYKPAKMLKGLGQTS